MSAVSFSTGNHDNNRAIVLTRFSTIYLFVLTVVFYLFKFSAEAINDREQNIEEHWSYSYLSKKIIISLALT